MSRAAVGGRLPPVPAEALRGKCDAMGPLVWMDLEMTGLDPQRDRILEAAALVTDAELTLVAEGPCLVIVQPGDVLATMDEWNQRHHAESGLLERVRRDGVPEAEAEAQLLDFVAAHCEKGKAPLAGNSIYQDRRFLDRYMPRLSGYLHYRNVDVSTVKELARRWYPDVFDKRPEKRGAHRALDDIHESLEELRYYRAHVFR